jgi:hypothetical protein
MNTLAFYNSLLRVLKFDDFETLDVNAGMEIVDALNGSLSTFHQHAPDRYQMREITLDVREPIVFTGTFTHGSRTIENINDLSINPAVIVSGAGLATANTVYILQDNGNYQLSATAPYPRIAPNGNGWQLDLTAEILAAYTNTNAEPWEGVWIEYAGSDGDIQFNGVDIGFNGTDLSYNNLVAYLTAGEPPTVTLLSEVLPQSWYGSAVQVDGDSVGNRIDSSTSLARAYTGATGTHNFTVYGDIVPLDGWSIERIYLDPILGSNRRALTSDSTYAQYSGRARNRSWSDGELPSIGTPRYFDIRHTGSLTKGMVSDSSLIHLNPIPATADSVRIGIVHHPVQFALSSLQEVVTLPLADSICRNILLPLAMAELIGSPNFTGNAQATQLKADKAISSARMLSPFASRPNHHIGTPSGY